MMVFWVAVLTLFWVSQRDQLPVMGEELAEENARVLAPPSSQEA